MPSGSASSPACSSERPCWPRISSVTESGIDTTPGKASDPLSAPQRSQYFLEKLIARPSISGDEAAGVQVCRDLMTEVGLATQLPACAGGAGALNRGGAVGAAPPR